MIRAIDAATSALRAYSDAMNVTAHNIANINTPAYRSLNAEFAEERTGVCVEKARATESPEKLTMDSYNSRRAEISDVNYATERINEILYLRSTQANAATFRAADGMLGAIIDMKA